MAECELVLDSSCLIALPINSPQWEGSGPSSAAAFFQFSDMFVTAYVHQKKMDATCRGLHKGLMDIRGSQGECFDKEKVWEQKVPILASGFVAVITGRKKRSRETCQCSQRAWAE